MNSDLISKLYGRLIRNDVFCKEKFSRAHSQQTVSPGFVRTDVWKAGPAWKLSLASEKMAGEVEFVHTLLHGCSQLTTVQSAFHHLLT